MDSVPKRLTGTCISHPLMTFTRDAEMAIPTPVNRPLGPSNDDAKVLKGPQFCGCCKFVGLAFAGLERTSRVGARLPVDRQSDGILSQTRGSSDQRLRCRFQGRTVGSEE